MSESSRQQQQSAPERTATDRTAERTRGPLTNAVEGAGGGVVTVIDATANVFEEVIHAAGRVGTTVLDEVFGLLGTAVGGLSDTASAMFQGRRLPRRTDTRTNETEARRAS